MRQLILQVVVLLLVGAFSSCVSLESSMGEDVCKEDDGCEGPKCSASDAPVDADSNLIQNVIDWIRENGGVFDERQEIRHTGVMHEAYASTFIPNGTVLLSVPWKLVLDGEGGDICGLVELVYKELDKNRDSKSDFGPYMQFLEAAMSRIDIPKDDDDGIFDFWNTTCHNNDSNKKVLSKTAAPLVSVYFHSSGGWYEMLPLRHIYRKPSLSDDESSNAGLVEHDKKRLTNVITTRDIEAGTPITAWSVPETWWSWPRLKMKRFLDCETINRAKRPIHRHETWKHLRRLYRQLVGDDQCTLLPNDNISGFENVPIQGAYSPGKGRGIFATGFIPKGTRVWTLLHQSARFRDGHAYRKFLALVSPPLACDLLKFGYIEDMGEEDDVVDLALRVDLDEASYTNAAGWDDEEEANIGCPPEMEGSDECEVNEYALRDIHAGEEIMSDYKDFAIPDAWKQFGL